jgi:Mg2+/citrate symporter
VTGTILRVALVLVGAGVLIGLLAGAFIVDLFRELQNVIP